MKTISRDKYFSELARLTALRGTCNKLQVGCVLVDNETNRIASVGYNSSISGTKHCSEIGCLLDNEGHCKRCPHAEIAAITNLTKRYTSLRCYLTHQPCIDCLKALASIGVNEIIFDEYYEQPLRDELNKELKIKMLVNVDFYTKMNIEDV